MAESARACAVGARRAVPPWRARLPASPGKLPLLAAPAGAVRRGRGRQGRGRLARHAGRAAPRGALRPARLLLRAGRAGAGLPTLPYAGLPGPGACQRASFTCRPCRCGAPRPGSLPARSLGSGPARRCAGLRRPVAAGCWPHAACCVTCEPIRVGPGVWTRLDRDGHRCVAGGLCLGGTYAVQGLR